MKKQIVCVILLCLLLFRAVSCQAITYPEKGGYLVDSTGLITEEIRRDIDTLSERTEASYGGRAYVYVTHFLGGTPVHEFARELFDRWQLTDQDYLLVMVMGEETSALLLGKKLSSALPGETADNVMSRYFRPDFQRREYGQAVASVLPEMSRQAARAFQKELDVSGLFSAQTVQAQDSADGWSDFITSGYVNWLDYGTGSQHTQHEYKPRNEGFHTGTIVFLAVLAWVLIRLSRKKRRR